MHCDIALALNSHLFFFFFIVFFCWYNCPLLIFQREWLIWGVRRAEQGLEKGRIAHQGRSGWMGRGFLWFQRGPFTPERLSQRARNGAG